MTSDAWVRETHTRIASVVIDPVQMTSAGGRNPMLVQRVRAEYGTATGELHRLELVGTRISAPTRFTAGYRNAQTTRRVKVAELAADHVPQVIRDVVEQYRPVVLGRYLITVKLPRHPEHDPRAKRTGSCYATPHCTDATGEHHTLLIEAADDTDAEAQAATLGLHITRIERVPVGAERLVGK